MTGRLIFSKLNELVRAINIKLPEDHQIGEITGELIREAFQEYNKFVARVDHGALFEMWYMGVPLEDFPPEPTKEQIEEAMQAEDKTAPSESEASEPEEEYPEGAVIFGGDYGDNDGDEKQEAQGGEPADEVPEVREDSGEEAEPDDAQDGEPVPSVS